MSRGRDGDRARSRAAAVPATAALVSVAALAALVRWSTWWPHPDMRQLWANAAIGLAALTSVGGAVAAGRRLHPRERRILLGLVLVAVLVGLLLVFPILRAATASAR